MSDEGSAEQDPQSHHGRNLSPERTCFVISPIGSIGSSERDRANDVFEYIISDAVKALGLEPLRADQIADPGIITSQIIEHTVHDALVVVDLSDHNPNVMYELAVRHAVRKPIVQIIDKSQRIPFDIQGMRTIQYDLSARGAASARSELQRAAEAVIARPESLITPIQYAVSVESLSPSNPQDVVLGQVSKAVRDLQEIASVMYRREAPRRRELDRPAIEAIMYNIITSLEECASIFEAWTTDDEMYVSNSHLSVIRSTMQIAQDAYTLAGVQHAALGPTVRRRLKELMGTLSNSIAAEESTLFDLDELGE